MNIGTGDERAWTYPVYNCSTAPTLSFTTGLKNNDDLGRNFPRMAKWCPDGSVALAQCENRSFQFIEFNPDPVTSVVSSGEPQENHNNPRSGLIEQAAPILDYIWYPSASPRNPASYCFVASVRECPVKLIDASDGRLRASYKVVDHRERQIAPHSLAFNLYANKLYCGFEDAIEVFDVVSPGEGSRLHTTPSKKSKDGLKGIISSLAFAPSYGSDTYFAAGSLTPSSSYTSNIALFTEDSNGTPIGYPGVDSAGGGVRAAVTQLQFNATSPHILYASFRRHCCIYSWDLRGDISTPLKVFRYGDAKGATRARDEMTNQKLRFDSDLSGRWLSSGDQNGDVSVFDVNDDSAESSATGPPEAKPTLRFHAHDDAVGSVGFHPTQPLLLSVSGSRHFHHDAESRYVDVAMEGSSSDSSSDDGSDDEREVTKRLVYHPFPLDASIRLWDFSQARTGLSSDEAAGL